MCCGCWLQQAGIIRSLLAIKSDVTTLLLCNVYRSIQVSYLCTQGFETIEVCCKLTLPQVEKVCARKNKCWCSE